MATLKALVDETTTIKNDIRTCHTNLKNNLIDKGLEVLETDKLPTLINKVADMSNIDIVVKSELPSTVKNGQIVVVSNKIPNRILFDFEYPTSSTENDIFIKLHKEYLGKTFTIGDNKKSINMYMFGVEQYIDGLYKKTESYIGEDGVWVGMNNYYLVDRVSKLDPTQLFETSFYPSEIVQREIKDYSLRMYTSNRYDVNSQYGYFTTVNTINSSSYSKVKAKIVGKNNGRDNGNFSVKILSKSQTPVSGNSIANKTIKTHDAFGTDSSFKEIMLEIDISSINEDIKIDFALNSVSGLIDLSIVEAYLE